jgi:hypothetical protein
MPIREIRRGGAWAFVLAGGPSRGGTQAGAAIRRRQVDSEISVLPGGGDVG